MVGSYYAYLVGPSGYVGIGDDHGSSGGYVYYSYGRIYTIAAHKLSFRRVFSLPFW